MVVQHNISAMTANRYYGVNNKGLASSLEKLASGYAINRAGDNAAGLAVSEKMRAQIGGLTQASKNAEDGISMVQTFEGALQETDSILQRMRTLAVQSANGSYQNDVDRDAIQLEFNQLNDELNQIADTDFNGVVMLNGGVMADGTVANNTLKVADRPKVDDISTTPDTAFTYGSVANGTVDSSGNGSLTVNGVNLKLKAGVGEATLGSVQTGETSYKVETPLEIKDGKVNGTINALESYKIDDKTTSIEIHGQNFTVKGDQLYDSDGNVKNKIDGLSVKVTKGEKVQLSGNYKIIDNNVVSPSVFDAATKVGSQSTGRVGGELDKDANGDVVVNNVKINLASGAGTAKSSDGVVTYTAASFAVGTDGTVTGEISASGTYTPSGATAGTPSDPVSAVSIGAGTGANDAKVGTVYKVTVNSTDYFTENGTDFYTDYNRGNNASASDNFTGQTAADVSAIFNGTDATDSTKMFAVSYDTASNKYSVTTTTNSIQIGDTKYDLMLDGDHFADGTTSKTLANGLTLENDGKVSGKYEMETKANPSQNIGTFKVATGVSTSDAYNHGTANMTFADSMTLQVGARGKDAVNFNFSYTSNGLGNLKADMNASARGLGTDQLSVNTQEEANYAIDKIDNALNKVNMIRATFGSVQNRLEHKISNIDTNTENLTAAESRIRDTQMDKEMMKFTSAQILSQASQSMLAQANSLPQGVLQLLG